MDALRKQLDVLMGANRNGDVTEVDRKYFDRDVCRLFLSLSGLCPHDLFQLTKMEMGSCSKIHSLPLRKENLINVFAKRIHLEIFEGTPYKSSSLTNFLKESLGGNSKL